MHTKTLTQLARDLKARKLSSEELTRAYLARIERFNPELNAFITVLQEQALTTARAADACIGKGDAGPLAGLPIAHKDIFCTRGVKTSCGSKMLDNFVAPYDATIVERLRQNGMVLLGKTNMDEFAMGSSNETSFYGPVKNPWDPTRVPGGSSGGQRRRWRRAWCRLPPAPIPAVPSASQRRSPVSPASSLLTGGCRVTA